MSDKMINEELLNQARSILLHEGKIRIATIQIKCGVGFIKAKDIFKQLATEGIGETNEEGILIVHHNVVY